MRQHGRRQRVDPATLTGSAEVESGATERLTFFSDAVAAIAMTLLAIELPVPAAADADEFWAQARENLPEYVTFLISFVTIAAHWSTHHRVFRFVARSDDQLRWFNMVWLLGIVCIPFVTKVVDGPRNWGAEGAGPSRFALYSATQLLVNAAMVAMLWHATRRTLLREDTPRMAILLAYSHALSVAGGFLLSIPLFFVWQRAWLLWILGPIVLGAAGRLLRRHADPLAATPGATEES